MTPPIVFVDTETNTLGHLARPREIAVIRRYAPTGAGDRPADTEHVWHVEDPLPPGTNPAALALNGYYHRCGAHPAGVAYALAPEWSVARAVHEQLLGAVMVGVGIHFDAAVLAAMFRRYGLPEEPWHYAIVDLKAVTFGYAQAGYRCGEPVPAELRQLPMKSELLAGWLKVELPTEDERHTALGDARWAARWYDALTGGGAA
jgi:hypothetical protein